MTDHCTPEQKQHILDLIDQVNAARKDIIMNLDKKTTTEKINLYRWLKSAQKEMIDFSRQYPDD